MSLLPACIDTSYMIPKNRPFHDQVTIVPISGGRDDQVSPCQSKSLMFTPPETKSIKSLWRVFNSKVAEPVRIRASTGGSVDCEKIPQAHRRFTSAFFVRNLRSKSLIAYHLACNLAHLPSIT